MKIAVLATAVALAFTIGASADPWNKKTTLDVKESILIPGKQLPPGKYVMKLADSQSSRHIVQIFNADETKVEATILAIPNMRLQPSGDTALGYWETPAGVPPALRSWFYPGDNYGQEFAYPKKIAEQLAAVNHAKVPWYEGSDTASQDAATLRGADVHDAGEPPPAASTLPANTESAASPSPAPTPEPVERSTVAAQPQQQPQLMAQNRPPADPPVPAPAPNDNTMPDTLPQTATPYAALALAGIALLLAGRILTAPHSS